MLAFVIPVLIIKKDKERIKKRKQLTHITVEEDYVTGMGEIVNEGTTFGGISVGSDGFSPMLGGAFSKHKQRNFMGHARHLLLSL